MCGTCLTRWWRNSRLNGGRSFPFAASDAAVEEAQRVVKAVGALVPEPLYIVLMVCTLEMSFM
jgi:hypothetical protein